MKVFAVDLGGTKTKAGIVKNGKLIAKDEFAAQSSGSLISYLSIIKKSFIAL